jgi:hypothetical protein
MGESDDNDLCDEVVTAWSTISLGGGYPSADWREESQPSEADGPRGAGINCRVIRSDRAWSLVDIEQLARCSNQDVSEQRDAEVRVESHKKLS